jgi:lipoyl(octanoyl) transferase
MTMQNKQQYTLYQLGQVPFQEAWEFQKDRVLQLDLQQGPESLILLEHPHTITLGSAGNAQNLLLKEEELKKMGITFVPIDRGGDITYHGPGQLIGYPILYLGEGSLDAHQYLRTLEEVVIRTLAEYDIKADRKPLYTGAWVGYEKIAAIGVKFNKCRHRKGYITSHGFALNVNTNLSMFDTIIPCGIREYGVTSIEKIMGYKVDQSEVAAVMTKHFNELFDRLPIDASLPKSKS